MSSPPPATPVTLRPVDDLKLTAPNVRLLKAQDIYYIGDLIQRTEAELRTRRFSSTAIVEIRTALWRLGLDLSKD